MCRWTPPHPVVARIFAPLAAFAAAVMGVWVFSRRHLNDAASSLSRPKPTQDLIEEFEEFQQRLDANIDRHEREVHEQKERIDALREEIDAHEKERARYAHENP